MTGTTLLLETPTVLEALRPFEPDDNQKGTFLVLRISGADQKTALKLVNRKYRSWQNWRSTDEDFLRLDDLVPQLQVRFGGEARVLRTAMLDISIIEAGIIVFNKIIVGGGKGVSSDMWAYATKLAGLRVPLMMAKEESGNPWEKLANSIQNTMTQRELTIREVNENGIEKVTTTKETMIQQSPEQRQLVDAIVGQVLRENN
jgi:hypothetical protein